MQLHTQMLTSTGVAAWFQCWVCECEVGWRGGEGKVGVRQFTLTLLSFPQRVYIYQASAPLELPANHVGLRSLSLLPSLLRVFPVSHLPPGLAQAGGSFGTAS